MRFTTHCNEPALNLVDDTHHHLATVPLSKRYNDVELLTHEKLVEVVALWDEWRDLAPGEAVASAEVVVHAADQEVLIHHRERVDVLEDGVDVEVIGN